MKRKLLTFLLASLSTLGLFTSCIEDEVEELGDQGQTFVKIAEAPEKKFFFSPFTDTKKLDLFSVRRDANSEAALNTPKTVTLVPSADMIEHYNEENHESFELLPEEAYTISNAAVQKSGNGYNFAFNNGDFAQDFAITLDGSKWTDLGKKYALAFKVQDANGLPLASGKDSVIVLLSIKNKYDGNYEVEATKPMADVVAPNLSGYYPLDSDLHTTGPNSVVMFAHTYLQGYWGHPIKNGSAESYYGNFAPIFTMDADGNVISVTNYYGQGTNSSKRGARLDTSGVNKFTVNADGTKVLEVSYVMTQGGADRTFFHEKWTYKGER